MDQLLAEVTDCEFKIAVERSRPKSWLKTVSAFANTIGGTVLFGVDDATHKPVGLENPQADVEFITQQIRERIDPAPHFRIEIVEKAPRLNLVAVSVDPDMQTPHYYHADGRRVAFVRLGDESIEAPSEVLNELILKGTNQTYDGLSTSIKLDDASFTVLRATYKRRCGGDFTQSDFSSFGLTDAIGNLTNAGALLADEPLVRHSRIFCTRWNGLHKDEALDDAEYSGSLLILLREGEAFAKRHNRLSWVKTPDARDDRPSYAERAITEALVNALIHRDYLVLGSEVHLDIYDNRLSISSPGVMPRNGRLPDDVAHDEIESIRRNPVLADLFQRMDFMERRGSGLRKICQATESEDNYEERFLPKFENGNGFFRVTLWDMNYKEVDETPQATDQVADQVTDQVTDQVGRLLAALGNEELSAAELMDRLSLSHRPTFRENYLNPALAAGLIERTVPDKPSSRLQRYRRSQKAY